jgi:hypothetical protein
MQILGHYSVSDVRGAGSGPLGGRRFNSSIDFDLRTQPPAHYNIDDIDPRHAVSGKQPSRTPYNEHLHILKQQL